MLAKWFLAAALLRALGTTAPAQQPTPPHAAPVTVEIRGRFQVLYPPASQDGDIMACLPPIQYAIEADGQRFHLNMNRFADKARELDGQLVIVTGPLELDTVTVNDLRQPTDDALIQYVKVNVAGQLEMLEFGTRTPEHPLKQRWTVRAGERSFALDFASDKVRAEAEKLIGKGVLLHGRLKNGRILVEGIGIDDRP